MKRSFGIVLTVILSAAPVVPAPAKPMIGWAQEAHPDYSEDVFRKHLAEQKRYGANLLWIGHNNPGYVDKNKVEPGLSFAVYEALKDPSSPLHADAAEQLAAVKRLLEAGRAEGFKALLAIGYQIQMGPVWNKRHPESLRREHDGSLFSAGGPSASYLSADYQRDIQDYYRWVYREVVTPYKDVLFMLNLADEPHGGDYSAAAETAFKAETGMTFAQADRSVQGKIRKGRFENLYIANYAKWSAGVWKKIDPGIRVTMSFCGSHGRFINFEPSISAIFRDTPENFDVTFDAFLIDNQPGDPIDAKHVSALAIFLRQVGELSQRYHKRVWLWPEANNWILSQWSPVKGNISDVMWGVRLLKNMSAAAGIQLGGLAVWNLDVKEQGLFRDTHPLTYDPQRMFEKISADFKTEPDPMRLRDDLLVWIPESEADYLIGRRGYDYADRIYLLDVYSPLLEEGIIPQLSSEDVPAFDRVKTIFLISKYPPRLLDSAYAGLSQRIADGATLVSNYPVLRPKGAWPRWMLSFRFYWNAILSSVTGKPRSIAVPWGRGKTILVFGRMNEKRRNILREIPPEVVAEIAGTEELPANAGGARGLLAFPQAKTWVFYNVNPGALRVNLRPKTMGSLVAPDGSRVPVKEGQSTITVPHGAWLELAR